MHDGGAYTLEVNATLRGDVLYGFFSPPCCALDLNAYLLFFFRCCRVSMRVITTRRIVAHQRAFDVTADGRRSILKTGIPLPVESAREAS